MGNIKLYEPSGWIDTIRNLDTFGIVPEIRAQGTISKGYSTPQKPVSLDYFLVHKDPEPTRDTVTLPDLLNCYGVKQDALKTLHVSIPSPALSFKTGRFKYGKKSGVLCSSDDNVVGHPLMTLKAGKIILELGTDQECESCPFNEDGTCKETVLVLFTINSPTIDDPAPFGFMLFKMSLPRTARNPFFGDYALAMELAYTTVLRYGLDHQHVPQSILPFLLSLVKRRGQYFNKETQSQTKTTYYVPQIRLDYDRLCVLLDRFAKQFQGHQLYAAPQQKEIKPVENPKNEALDLSREAIAKNPDRQIITEADKRAKWIVDNRITPCVGRHMPVAIGYQEDQKARFVFRTPEEWLKKLNAACDQIKVDQATIKAQNGQQSADPPENSPEDPWFSQEELDRMAKIVVEVFEENSAQTKDFDNAVEAKDRQLVQTIFQSALDTAPEPGEEG